MTNARSKQFLVLVVTLLQLGLAMAQAPKKAESVQYVHTEMALPTPPVKVLYLKDSVPGATTCSATIKKATLNAWFNFGPDYKMGDNATLNASVTVTIRAYPYCVGNSGLIATYTKTLPLNNTTPEQLFPTDFTANYGSIKRFDITLTAYSLTTDATVITRARNNIRMNVFYGEEFNVDVTTLPVLVHTSPAATANLTANPVTFTWKQNTGTYCKITPNYQFQLLRLYNINVNKKKAKQIDAKVDWNQALSLEIMSSDTSVTMPLTEGSGFYLWRVRPIGTKYPNGISDSRNYGVWSTNVNNGTISMDSTNILSFTDRFYYQQFDDTLNWVHNRNFQEGDASQPKVRISEKMSYANSLQQVIQNQSRLQTDNLVMVNQTLYDWSGRAALQTMAVPDTINASGNKAFAYRRGFVKRGTNLYKSANFDDDSTYNNPGALSFTNYSNYFTDTYSDKTVPNAEGYPFGRTLFARDGTNREIETGSPGSVHRIKNVSAGNIHTNRAYYSSVSDAELIRLFGDEAPASDKVYKIINIDANNTASVSYIDIAGQTIATCLSVGLDSLDALPSQTSFTVVDTLKGSIKLGSYGKSSSKGLSFSTSTPVTFTYHLDGKSIKDACTNYCNNCDYTVKFIVRSNTNDDSLVAKKVFYAPTINCNTSGNWTWDTSFTKTLAPGSYLVEKQIYANNLVPSKVKTYLQYHTDSITKTLQKNSYDALTPVYNYLNNSDVSGLFNYLGVNTNYSNPDSVYKDSSVIKTVGCFSIKIPIKFCGAAKTCPGNKPDFEGHFKKRWPSPTYNYANIITGGYYNFLNDSNFTSMGMPGFKPGQFNFMIKNMLNDGYLCSDLWSCWERVTENYEILKKTADSLKIYKFSVLNEFLKCAGKKYIGYKTSNPADTAFFRGQAYKYFYVATGTKLTNCLSALGTPAAQDSLKPKIPTNKKWENIFNCYYSNSTVPVITRASEKAEVEGKCNTACAQRFSSFVNELIRMYHNDSMYVEGDKYMLRADGYLGNVYSFSNVPNTPSTFKTMAEIECAARSLVRNCQLGCATTIVGDTTGTKAQQAAMAKSMTWSYQLKRTGCDGTYTVVTPLGGTSGKLNKTWERDYGSTGEDYLYSILNTSDGGYLLGGYTTATGNDVTGPLHGAKDYWLVKINANGVKIWDRAYGGTGDDLLRSMVETPDGGFLLGGNSYSGVSGNKTAAICNAVGGNNPDYWVVKVDMFGTKMWDKAYGGTQFDNLVKIVKTSDGNYLLAGFSQSISSGCQKGTLSIPLGSGGDSLSTDYWIIKINSAGTVIWSKVYGTRSTGPGIGYDVCNDAIELADGNYLFAGYSSGGNDSSKTQASFGGSDYWIIKTDPNGNKIWDKAFGGTLNEQLFSVKQTMDGKILLAGQSNSQASGNKTTNSLYYDGWVVKVYDDPALNSTIFDKTYGGVRTEGVKSTSCSMGGGSTCTYYTSGMKIDEMPDKSLMLALSSSSEKSGNKGASAFNSAANDSSDYWVLKLDSVGAIKTDTIFGGKYFERFITFTSDNAGNFLFGGISRSDNSSPGNKTTPLYSTPGIGYDMWVVKTTLACTHDNICFKWVQFPTLAVDTGYIKLTPISCDSSASVFIRNAIVKQVGEQIDNYIAAYKNNYLSKCGNPDSISDIFKMQYSLGYYHYTLYYYDRAGNLVRSVMPKGVDLSSTSRNTHPAHTFVTEYRNNSIRQLLYQNSPDGGATKYWYDDMGKLRYSQNAQQLVDNKYSYTKYDKQGRITEVGQSSDSITNFFNPWNLNNSQNYPVNNTAQRTYMFYDYAPDGYMLQNTLNRVSKTTNDDGVSSYYSYDSHGNVVWVSQKMPLLHDNAGIDPSISYEYDLISGKMLALHYNQGQTDEYHQRFFYDADQRLSYAQTAWGPGVTLPRSKGVLASGGLNIGWDNDAKYIYYKHGPVKRTELGEDHVQGVDNVYTLQGWLKGINYPTLLSADDPGGDDNNTFASDAFGMVLGYNYNDFKRTGSKYNPTNAALISSQAGADDATSSKLRNLYNGNISNWTLNSAFPGGKNRMGLRYRYDQLNRLKKEDYNEFTSSWTVKSDYDNSFAYDANGNITGLLRNATGTSNLMDSLSYKYFVMAGKPTNRLSYVKDIVANGSFTTDIDNQAQFQQNYSYDAIGNITGDDYEQVTINWNVYGKVSSITPYYPLGQKNRLEYLYDAAGNRVVKIVKPLGTFKEGGDNPDQPGAWTYTYYIRDAQGNPIVNYSKVTVANKNVYNLTDASIYGRSRAGVYNPNLQVRNVDTGSFYSGGLQFKTDYPRTITKKDYEITDHLGNMRVTVNDRKAQSSSAILYQSSFPLNNPGPTGINGWTQQTTGITLSTDAVPRLKCVSSTINLGALRALTTVVGAKYTLDITIDVGTAGNVGIAVYNATFSNVLASTTTTVNGRYTLDFTATTTTSNIKVYLNNTGTNLNYYISNDVMVYSYYTYLARVDAASDYYAGGMQMPGRQYIGTNYRYGFNGMEKVDELLSNGNHYTAEFWEYDPRIVRRWNRDPIVKLWESPYACFAGNPIYYSDPNGLDPVNSGDPVRDLPSTGNGNADTKPDPKTWGISLSTVTVVEKLSFGDKVRGVLNKIGNFLINLLPNVSVIPPSGYGGESDHYDEKKQYNPNSFWGKKTYVQDLSWLGPILETQRRSFFGRGWKNRNSERQPGNYDTKPKTGPSVKPPVLDNPTDEDIKEKVNLAAEEAHGYIGPNETLLYASPGGELTPGAIFIIRQSSGKMEVYRYTGDAMKPWRIELSTYKKEQLGEYEQYVK